MPRISLLRETKILALICVFDLAFTTWLYFLAGCNIMVERNPLMRYFLVTWGLAGFYLAKAIFTVPGLVVMEWYRTRNPEFPARVLRLAIVAYAAIFLSGLGLSFVHL